MKHHHHNARGNTLYCPDDNCEASLVNNAFAIRFSFDLDLAAYYKLGPADHTHDDARVDRSA